MIDDRPSCWQTGGGLGGRGRGEAEEELLLSAAPLLASPASQPLAAREEQPCSSVLLNLPSIRQKPFLIAE